MAFISHGEQQQILADLGAFYCDPPLSEQLRPLSTAELTRRAAVASTATGAHTPDVAAAAPLPGVVPELVPSVAVAPSATAVSGTAPGKELALSAAVAAAAEHLRAERRLRGRPLPKSLGAALLAELRTLRWPAASARPGVDADKYLVVSSRRSAQELGTRHPHYALRALCDELLTWHSRESGEPCYQHTAIAVTKNFRGSPHVDQFDRCEQLAVSLGDFTGGELCVEEDQENVTVVDTHDRLAKVDGRRVHWVRAFRGGDRYSLIFYNTAEEQ